MARRRRWINKCHSNPAYPRWMYYVGALSQIATGVGDLLLLPFNRHTSFAAYWAGVMLRTEPYQHKEEVHG